MGLSPLDRFGTRQKRTLVETTADPYRQRSRPFGQDLVINDYLRPVEAVESASSYTDPNVFLGNAYTAGFGETGGYGGNKYTDMLNEMQNAYTQGGQQLGALGQAGGQAVEVGGAWAALDQHNAEINAAAARFGVPANLLKSMINRESSGNWDRGPTAVWLDDPDAPGGGFNILPFVGIKELTAKSWGLDWGALQGNKQAQIEGMARIVKGLADQYGGFDKAAYVYFGGEQALQPGGYRDVLGMDSNTYGQKAIDDWRMLDQKAGYTGGYGDGGIGTGIVQAAMQYVGVPYIWGSLPGADQDPWQTGWDCSAFVNWLDDKYGANEIPAGSHYQYQDSVDKGLLFMDLNQLRPGDLLFWDTGNTSGGGANLNRAGHVSMYIGNGQMIHAANPNAGTIISNLSDYQSMYPMLGARHMGWSAAGQATFMPQQQQFPSFTSLWQKYLRKAA